MTASFPAPLGPTTATSVQRAALVQLRHVSGELIVREAVLAHHVRAERLDIGVLALPRGLVHERDEPHALVPADAVEDVDDIVRRHFATQVHEVVSAQQTGFSGVHDGVDEDAGMLGEPRLPRPCPDAQRVEHGRHSGCRHLGVMRDDGSDRIPKPLRPRLEVPLDLIGV